MDASILRTIVALILTIALELLAFFIFIRKNIPQKDHVIWILFIIGMNLFTNPVAHFLYYFLSANILRGFSWIITECTVVLTEALLICLVMRVQLKQSLIYSLIINGCSIVVGEYIWWGLYLLY